MGSQGEDLPTKAKRLCTLLGNRDADQRDLIELISDIGRNWMTNESLDLCTQDEILKGTFVMLLPVSPLLAPTPPTLLEMSQLATTIISFFVDIAERFPDVAHRLQKNFGILDTLQGLLRVCKPRSEELMKVLTLAELVSEAWSLEWLEPSYFGIANTIIPILLGETEFGKRHETCLRILVNLCYKHVTCRVMIRTRDDYKGLWAHLVAQFMDPNSSMKTLVVHLLCLLDDTPKTAMVKNAFNYVILGGETLLKGITVRENVEMQKSCVKNIADLTRLVETLIIFAKKYCTPWEIELPSVPEPNGSGDHGDDDNRPVMSILKDTLGKVMSSLAMQAENCRANFHSKGTKYLAALVKALTPDFIHPEDLKQTDCYMNALRIAEIIFEKCIEGARLNFSIMIYYHLIKQMKQSARIWDDDIYMDKYSYSLRVCIASLTPQKPSFETAVAGIRTIKILAASCPTMHEQIKSKIDELKLIDNIENDVYQIAVKAKPHERTNVDLNISVFAVELYSLLFSVACTAVPNSLYTSTDQSVLDFHIANCILNGDTQDTATAFHIVNIFNFAFTSSFGVAKWFKDLQKSKPPVSLCKLRPYESDFGSPLVTDYHGATATKSRLPEFKTSSLLLQPESTRNFYKLKEDMLTRQLHNLNQYSMETQQINEALMRNLNDYHIQLDELKVKYDEEKLRAQELAAKYDKLCERTVTQINDYKKSLDQVKKQSSWENERYEKVKLRCGKLSVENAKLNKTVEDLKKSEQQLREKNNQLAEEVKNLEANSNAASEEIKQMKTSIGNLHAELHKKDEEINRNRQLLQKEQRLVAHIRGLIAPS